MVTLGSLWLAILLAAVVVWIASAVIWTALPHHRKDFARLASEEEARSLLRGTPPGMYSLPHAESDAALKDPHYVAKMNEGPVGFLTVMPSGPPAMGGRMVRSFLFFLLVAFVFAYLASNYVPAGVSYIQVFRFAAVTSWMAFGFAYVQESVWFGRPWSNSARHLVDAFVYGLLIGGVFGWLWPTM